MASLQSQKCKIYLKNHHIIVNNKRTRQFKQKILRDSVDNDLSKIYSKFQVNRLKIGGDLSPANFENTVLR